MPGSRRTGGFLYTDAEGFFERLKEIGCKMGKKARELDGNRLSCFFYKEKWFLDENRQVGFFAKELIELNEMKK